MARTNTLDRLIRTLFERGDDLETVRAVLAELPSHGDAAIDATIAAMRNPPKSRMHPRDPWDVVFWVFHVLARRSSEHIIDQMEAGALDPFIACSALANARGKRSLQVLIKRLRDKKPHVRSAAADSLISRRCRPAIPHLVELLKDRSSSVCSIVVFAMHDRQWLRCPEALPRLRTIVASERMKKQCLGTWRTAQRVIELIEVEFGTPAADG